MKVSKKEVKVKVRTVKVKVTRKLLVSDLDLAISTPVNDSFGYWMWI